MRSGIAAFYIVSILGFGAENINFDNLKPDAMPPYWTAAVTHGGTAPRWEVVRDRTAPSRQNVFAQVVGAEGEFEFPMAIYDRVICKEGDLSVKFKITGGRHARTAGIVWRFQDPDNYYLLHFSADEKNIVMFRVKDGKAHPVPVAGAKRGVFGVPHDVRVGQWYVAKVMFRGPNMRVLFGNRVLFDAVDESIPNAGKTGVWTKAGTQAEFDDFRIDKKS
jgi:hypothetical protein